MEMEIRRAEHATDWLTARRLFGEYAASLGHDLCFQNFSHELRTLETMYGPPGGSLLLAAIDEEDRGCVGLRRLEDGVGEMKRLYLQPEFRGGGRGLALARAILTQGQRLGYRRVRLDTLPAMQTAIAMYRRLGFREIPPYYPNPIEGALYMELVLEPFISATTE